MAREIEHEVALRINVLRWNLDIRRWLKISKIVISDRINEKNSFTDFLISVQAEISKDLRIVVAHILGLMR